MSNSGTPSSSSKNDRSQINQQPIQYNPISQWMEPIENSNNLLTLFEVHRDPRPINRDVNARSRIPIKVLNAEFHCPVCLGYMKKTSIVMECLHRFCGECIQKCLRLGKKECPSCRIHIPSRRSLRPDPNFDNLIANIYGDIFTLEQTEEKEIEALNKSVNMNNAYAESRARGILQQAIYRKKKNPKAAAAAAVALALATAAQPAQQQAAAAAAAGTKRKGGPGGGAVGTSGNRNNNNATTAAGGANEKEPKSPVDTVPKIQNMEKSQLVDFCLRRHPQEMIVDRLDREYIRTNCKLTVNNLKMFLSRKLSYTPLDDFQILTISGGKGVILDDSVTIGDVKNDIAESGGDDDLVLHFRAVSSTI